MWKWLTEPTYHWGFLMRVLIKAVILFTALNVSFALADPLPALGKLSIYNTLVAGRERLPYGANPRQSYNLSLNNLNAMFASHQLASQKQNNEYRVILIGDSATWGFLLTTENTLAGQINQANATMPNGRQVRAYNLGYPTMSLTKDLMLLNHAMQYDPDLVVWLVTLESFPRHTQLDSPLVANNRPTVTTLVEQYNLDLPLENLQPKPTILERTIIGQRRPLSDLIRLQIYGIMWETTHIDQHIPEKYDLRQSDFDQDVSWKGLNGPQPFPEGFLALDVLRAGAKRTGDVPFLLVNEPMFISTGENSDLHYNFFYPRWIYDAYHNLLNELAVEENWNYIDMWNAIPPQEFTDSPVHMTPAGTKQQSELLLEAITANN